MIFAGRKECCLREMKKVICSIDRGMVSVKCAEKAPMIAKVAEHLGWAKPWVQTLDLGGKSVLGLRMISRAMSHHGRGMHLYAICAGKKLLWGCHAIGMYYHNSPPRTAST